MKKQTVQGRRSPRWALWEKMTIPCKGGIKYLFRIRIIQTPWFGIYLHDIFEPDDDRGPHNHPWSFLSFVLKGWYREYYIENPESKTGVEVNTWDRFSIHRMDKNSAHRITECSEGLKTLIFTGPRTKGWGFYIDGKFIPWQEYHEDS